MSQLTVNTLQLGQSATPANNFVLAMPSPQDGTIKLSRGNVGSTTQDVISVNASGVVSFPQTPLTNFGKLVSVNQTVVTGLVTITATGWQNITGLAVNITPTSASNNVLVMACVHGSTNTNATARLVRTVSAVDTPIFIGTEAAGSGVQGSGGDFYGGGYSGNSVGHYTFLDSPATTSTVTYKVQVNGVNPGSYPIYINTTNFNVDAVYRYRGASSIIVMEVAP